MLKRFLIYKKVKEIILKELNKRNKTVKFHLVSNPEFLKEGDAISDFMRAYRIILGTDNQYSLELMKKLYSPFIMN